jgi:hypothetical protein
MKTQRHSSYRCTGTFAYILNALEVDMDESASGTLLERDDSRLWIRKLIFAVSWAYNLGWKNPCGT